MKIKLIFFTLLVLFLVACTSVTVKNYDNVKTIISDESSIKKENDSITRNANGIIVNYEKVEADIIIENTQLFPNHITIPLENTTEIIIQNNDNLTYKLDIPLYGSEKQRDIYPYESIILKFTPKVKGYTAIKLGQFTLGSIEVQ